MAGRVGIRGASGRPGRDDCNNSVAGQQLWKEMAVLFNAQTAFQSRFVLHAMVDAYMDLHSGTRGCNARRQLGNHPSPEASSNALQYRICDYFGGLTSTFRGKMRIIVKNPLTRFRIAHQAHALHSAVIRGFLSRHSYHAKQIEHL